MKRKAVGGLLGLLLGLCLSAASAHRGIDTRLKVAVMSGAVHIELGLNGAELIALTPHLDSDGDGRVSRVEFEARQAAIADLIAGGLSLSIGESAALAPAFFDTPIPGFSNLKPTEPVEHVRLIARYDYIEGEGPLVLGASILKSRSAPTSVLVRWGALPAPESGLFALGPETGYRLELPISPPERQD